MAGKDIHGECRIKTTEYVSWLRMRQRCNSAKHQNHKFYGGRGIKVCERWNDYRLFLLDMGRKPTNKHTIDRINPDGDYEPGNCRWATMIEQNNNRRDNRIVSAFGKSMTVAQWAREMNISPSLLLQRISRDKMSPEDALSKPSGKPRKIKADRFDKAPAERDMMDTIRERRP